jgi:hypothetical protein
MIILENRYLVHLDQPRVVVRKQNFSELSYVIDTQNNATYRLQLDNTQHNGLPMHAQW